MLLYNFFTFSLVWSLSSLPQLYLFLGHLVITLFVSLLLHVLIEKPYVLFKLGSTLGSPVAKQWSISFWMQLPCGIIIFYSKDFLSNISFHRRHIIEQFNLNLIRTCDLWQSTTDLLFWLSKDRLSFFCLRLIINTPIDNINHLSSSGIIQKAGRLKRPI